MNALMNCGLMKRCKRFVRDEEVPTATEYAVMLALIVVVAIFAIQTLGGRVTDTFANMSDQLQ